MELHIGYIYALLAAYLIGSVPNGLIIGKSFWNVDLREHGSFNIGATNAYRTIGKKAAFIIFLLDALKGMLGVWLGALFTNEPSGMILGGIMAIVGHNWPLFLGFKGGKGVATGLGVILMLMPKITFLVFLTWAVIVYLTKFVSLASIVAALLVPILSYAFDLSIQYQIFAVLAAVFVVYRHKANIGRLLSGTESKIKAGGR
jgi:glycerol-3-phosphate acyltransferase PlsY